MSAERIAAIGRDPADLITVVHNADPADKADSDITPRQVRQPGSGMSIPLRYDSAE
jgi:hypothetical protein